ncbi:DNA/RNA non-specific endonuclease, partial [Chromohalobacter sp. HP20-39]
MKATNELSTILVTMSTDRFWPTSALGSTLAEPATLSIFFRRVLHMSPSGDFGDLASQQESFSLANVVPQNSVSNRRMWSHLETSTRRLVRQTGEAYVVTGPAFTDGKARYLNEHVRVPDYLWKA